MWMLMRIRPALHIVFDVTTTSASAMSGGFMEARIRKQVRTDWTFTTTDFNVVARLSLFFIHHRSGQHTLVGHQPIQNDMIADIC